MLGLHPYFAMRNSTVNSLKNIFKGYINVSIAHNIKLAILLN